MKSRAEWNRIMLTRELTPQETDELLNRLHLEDAVLDIEDAIKVLGPVETKESMLRRAEALKP